MSNRGRQNVASFLVFDLQLDWRVGADHFESTLLGSWSGSALHIDFRSLPITSYDYFLVPPARV